MAFGETTQQTAERVTGPRGTEFQLSGYEWRELVRSLLTDIQRLEEKVSELQVRPGIFTRLWRELF